MEDLKLIEKISLFKIEKFLNMNNKEDKGLFLIGNPNLMLVMLKILIFKSLKGKDKIEQHLIREL